MMWHSNSHGFIDRYTQCCCNLWKYIILYSFCWLHCQVIILRIYFIVSSLCSMLVPGLETSPTTGQSSAKEWAPREPECQSHEEDEDAQRGEAESTWVSPEKGCRWVPAACQWNLAADRPVEGFPGFVLRVWHCWSESKVIGNGCLVIGHRRGLGPDRGQSGQRDWGNNLWGFGVSWLEQISEWFWTSVHMCLYPVASLACSIQRYSKIFQRW